jgi:hypothetical protein
MTEVVEQTDEALRVGEEGRVSGASEHLQAGIRAGLRGAGRRPAGSGRRSRRGSADSVRLSAGSRARRSTSRSQSRPRLSALLAAPARVAQAGSSVRVRSIVPGVALAEQATKRCRSAPAARADAVRKTVEQGRRLRFRPIRALRETGGGADQDQTGDALRREQGGAHRQHGAERPATEGDRDAAGRRPGLRRFVEIAAALNSSSARLG